ncbi:MAG TPA: MlaD family protein [Solirubrobacteraceae bacterium]|nr:MlaD family protein [Solirubrobacteraceae bacterium]
MRRLLAIAAVLAAVLVVAVIVLTATSGSSAAGTYRIEFDNAFGLVSGADFKVAGVRAGTISSITLPRACTAGHSEACHAVVTVHVTESGFGTFRSDAFCQSRPQSLIGEYFVDCQPGAHGRVLPPGSTIPITHTQSTIPADLLQNVLRLPYRQRATLIINELGAGVAGRSDDLQAALRRAVPALTETDNLLKLLADDSNTLAQLTVSADTAITALADNSAQVQRFIVEANNTATATAAQAANLRGTLRLLPGFLAQLRPAMAELGAAAAANEPALQNLNASAAQLTTFLRALPAFSRSAVPAIRSLGQTSVTGTAAVEAAAPTVAHLKAFAQPTPELSQNLAIVLRDLDDRSRAVEPDSRSPGGKGYTGLEALLQYVFNQALAINTFGPFGHVLAVDSFVDTKCSPYATPATIALSLKQFGPSYRNCYAWLGPNQPGVNETDPSNPRACVPDPGGAPPGERGPKTNACKLNPATLSPGAAPVRATAQPAPGPPSPPRSAAATSTATHTTSAIQQLLDYLLGP